MRIRPQLPADAVLCHPLRRVLPAEKRSLFEGLDSTLAKCLSFSLWPELFRADSQGLELVNARVEAFAETAPNVSYIDCGQPFFATPELLNADLMPDALHPSAAGMSISISRENVCANV